MNHEEIRVVAVIVEGKDISTNILTPLYTHSQPPGPVRQTQLPRLAAQKKLKLKKLFCVQQRWWGRCKTWEEGRAGLSYLSFLFVK